MWTCHDWWWLVCDRRIQFDCNSFWTDDQICGQIDFIKLDFDSSVTSCICLLQLAPDEIKTNCKSNELFRFQFELIYFERTWLVCTVYYNFWTCSCVSRVVYIVNHCVLWMCVRRVNHKRLLLNCVDYFSAQLIHCTNYSKLLVQRGMSIFIEYNCK